VRVPGTGASQRHSRHPGVAPDFAERLLDVREAATLLAVKPATLYQWAYQRRIPVVKLMGRALRFRVSDIERLIAQGARPALREDERTP
jgi:excisionase family DNA binding protein